jgi:hypothetical protein
MPKPTKKFVAFDQAIAHLKKAGLSQQFMKALENDPKLLAAVKKVTPKGPGPVAADWSCCITVSKPLHNKYEEVSNPVRRAARTTKAKTSKKAAAKVTKKRTLK